MTLTIVEELKGDKNWLQWRTTWFSATAGYTNAALCFCLFKTKASMSPSLVWQWPWTYNALWRGVSTRTRRPVLIGCTPSCDCYAAAAVAGDQTDVYCIARWDSDATVHAYVPQHSLIAWLTRTVQFLHNMRCRLIICLHSSYIEHGLYIRMSWWCLVVIKHEIIIILHI